MTTRTLETQLARLQRELERERDLRRRAEARADAQDLASQFGRSAGDMVHQLRNPLAGIEGFAGLAKRGLAADSPVHAHLERIEAGVHRANRILTTMSDMARSPELAPCPVTAVEVIQGALSILCIEHPDAARRFTVDASPSVSIHADSAAAKSALLDLMRNAAESGAEKLSVTADEGADGRVRISVIDNGPGIEDVQRALRLFTTTRKGADGVGLPQAERFALLHDGSMAIETRPGTGTTVTLELPSAQPGSTHTTQAKEQS